MCDPVYPDDQVLVVIMFCCLLAKCRVVEWDGVLTFY